MRFTAHPACESVAGRKERASISRTVLVVDDEGFVLKSLQRLLRNEDITLLMASSGEEGLAILERHSVQLVISDQRMPGMSGLAFLQRVKEQYPDAVRVLLSGYERADMLMEAVNQGEVYRCLLKPWNGDELKAVIRQCFEHHDLVRENRELVLALRNRNRELQELASRLEVLVQERTRTLQLSQEILHALPVPVIGVDPDGMLVVSNDAVAGTFPSLQSLALGMEIVDRLPASLLEQVAHCMEGGPSRTTTILPLDGREVAVTSVRLENDGGVRGCVLCLEGHDDGR